MATTFLEPGGDADFLTSQFSNAFWGNGTGATVTIATDFVHGNHIKSIKYAANASAFLQSFAGTNADSGTRMSAYFYFNVLPTATANFFIPQNGSNAAVALSLTSAGVLLLRNNSNTTLGTGTTLSTGVWYRISIAYTITSTTVNRFEVFLNGVSNISVTNATITNIGTTRFTIGNKSLDATLDMRSSDHYVDNSSSLTDTGDIWVTAKRPNANGTTNGFTTQIGSGGSGYGTGHSPQVNERPLSTTNGWSMIGAGSAITEEYNIEGQGVGDITTVGGTIVDYVGWVSASSLSSETASIIVNNVSSNISLTSTTTLFTKAAGSTTYPAGTGTDIGIITTTALTTVSLYECGVLVAFTPPPPPPTYNIPALGLAYVS